MRGCRIGLGLYTVRRACDEDFEGTVRAVAAQGFEGVELFHLHGHAPAEVGGWLRELGLTATSRHISLEEAEGGLDDLATEARAVGWRRAIVAWLDPAFLDDPALPGRLARASVRATELGLELGVHNHDAEVRSGFLERLPETVFLELDAGWAWWGGADPVDLLGRGPLIHVKDFLDRDSRSFCPVGAGAVGYERIAPAAVSAGVEWLLVEQDESADELEATRQSLESLRRMLKA